MPMMTMNEEIASYGRLLGEIAGPVFMGAQKYFGNQLPYRWEFTTTLEPIQYAATIQLTGSDIARLNAMTEGQKREYLRTRFQHLFGRG
jgi:hypothetical protein